MALILGLLLFPVVGPTFQAKQANYVIQRLYQGFLGSATRYELVERKNIFERRIGAFQADTIYIKSFIFDAKSQKLSINNGKQLVQFEDQ